MKNKIAILLVLILVFASSCDLFNPGRVNTILVEVDRDNPLDGDFWERKTDFPGDKRGGPVLFVRDNLIYAGLGESEGTPHTDMWTYSTVNESWSEINITGAQLEYRADSSSTTYEYGGKVYIVEGWSHDRVWEYSVESGLVSQLEMDFTAIHDHGLDAAYTDDYVLFGTTNNEFYTYYRYNPATTELIETKQIGPDPSRYRDPVFFTIGDKIYTGGGHYPAIVGADWDDDVETTAYLEFFEYDPAVDSWTAIPSLPEAINDVYKGFAIDNTGYVLDDEGQLYSWTVGDAAWIKKAAFSDGYSLDYDNSDFITCGGAAYLIRFWAGFGVKPGQVYKYTP